jgi:hypothetical protein
MSVITEDSFRWKFPGWVNDPEIKEEDKRELFEMGMGDSFNDADAMEVNELCFYCAEHLSLPYIYWQGCHGDIKGERKGISLHAACATEFAQKLKNDVVKLEKEGVE